MARSMVKKTIASLEKKEKKAVAKDAKAKTAVKATAEKAEAKKAEAVTKATSKGSSPAEAKVKARVVANKIKAKAAAKASACKHETKSIKAAVEKVKKASKKCKGDPSCIVKEVENVKKDEKARSDVKKQKKAKAAKKEQRRDPKKFAAKVAARFARNAKRYGVPSIVPSERLARMSKMCPTGKYNARCMESMKKRA